MHSLVASAASPTEKVRNRSRIGSRRSTRSRRTRRSKCCPGRCSRRSARSAKTSRRIGSSTRSSAKVKNPRLAQKFDELSAIEKSLHEFDGSLETWEGTRLAKRHKEWLGEVSVIRGAVADEVAWIARQIGAGEKLREEGGLVIAKKVDPPSATAGSPG